MGKASKLRVRFAVDDDEQASKISALLDALGYEAVRELDYGAPQTRLRWALARLSNAAKLTERERDILDRVLQGRLNTDIGEELGISRATVKWHMHNIFTKTGTTTREALLREALQLEGVSRRELAAVPEAESESESEPEAESSDDD